jgi:hypothetical protein
MKGGNSKSVFCWRFFGSFLLGIIPAVLFGGCIIMARFSIGWNQYPWTTEGISSFCLVVGMLGLLIFGTNFWSQTSHIFVIRLNAGTIIYDEVAGSIRELLDKDTFFRDKNPVFNKDNYRIISVASNNYDQTLTVHPVTANPKVRDITCSLSLGLIEETITGFGQVIKFIGLTKIGSDWYSNRQRFNWDVFTKSLLYDFAEACSKELAELYNPLNEEQQERFKKLIQGFVKPRLVGSGLKIDSCSFSI